MTFKISTNVRFVLWRQKVPRAQWATWLAARCDLRPNEVRDIVQGRKSDEHVGEGDCARLAQALGWDAEADTLRFSDMASEGCNILKENLVFLFDSLGHGGKKALASTFQIDPTTISRWLNGSSQPADSTLRQLGNYFGLSSNADLRTDPVFLSAEPVSIAERRQWLIARLEKLSPDEFRELFPALRRLLDSP